MFYNNSLFLFLFGVFGILEAEESHCGISPSLERYKIFNQNRVFGGENSNEFDFPWFVWLYSDLGDCSGTVISEKWILTAAHCINGTESVEVFYGSVNWEIMKTKIIKGLRYFIHPGYVTGANDIALIELNGTLEFNAYVQPICLDSTVEPYLHEILTQIGMGKNFKKYDERNIELFSQNVLQDAPIAFIDNSICQSDGERKICVGGINHSSFPGDSGGPLLAIRDDRWVQIGIASAFGWKGVENESISIVVTDYYAKVSYYCNWIKETTNNEIQC